ncbi:hypothetical protein LSG31_14295 [Fodinisporobacter ferrooxydans]|uniref:Bile acid:sodium symporter n=1 Tax=Fodinisporobacter ferrooxydans TaxID=2901836 RepID=A0ABY4CFF6_9BACL|nr:hypothetical protein LSG31_14295 [Alicyclobacillaceae bacterium MYW30-H2]
MIRISQGLNTSMILSKANSLMDRWIYIVMPLLMGIGIIIHVYLDDFVNATPYLFMYLTFVSSLHANLRDFKELIHQKTSAIVILLLLHVIVPVCAFQIAKLFFPAQPDLIAGITLFMALPVGVTAIFWVGYAGASLMIALAFVTFDTLISPFVVPMSLHFVLGSTVSVNGGALVVSLLKLVVLPSVLGMWAGDKLRQSNPPEWLRPLAISSSKFCLYLIVLFNAALIAGDLHAVAHDLVKVIIVVAVLMILGYLVSLGFVSLFCKKKDLKIAFSYSGGIRNYTVGVVLATAFFSPTAAFPILLAMLLQHPTALLFTFIFKKLPA